MINILLVDDMDGNLTILEYLINEYMKSRNIQEYHISAHTDPAKAIQMVQNSKIDIIFLDVMMPYMNGFDFLQIVRNDPSVNQPIVVMVTALQGKKSKEKNQAFGANAYVIKPIKPEIITLMLDRYIEILKRDQFNIHETFEFKQNVETKEETLVDDESDEKIDSKKFYEKCDQEDLEDTLEDINNAVFRIFDCADESLAKISIDLVQEMNNITLIFKAYQNLFANFEELEDIRFLIGNFNLLFEKYNIECVDAQSQEKIAILLKSMIISLLKYRQKVFIDHSEEDIGYIKIELENKHKQIDQILTA